MRPMRRRFLAYLVTVCAALAILAPAWAADVVFPPGLRIGLEPAGDLKPSRQFSGFEDADRKVGITILDLPASTYAELERAANAKEQHGIDDLKRENFSFRSGSGLLITGRARVNDVTLHKWFLLATAPVEQDLTTLITVEVPESELAIYSDAVVRKALASVTFRPPPIEEQLGLLPFKLGQLGGFRVMKVLANGVVILTEGPTNDISKQPYVIVSIGRGAPEQPDDRARFARDLLSSAPLRELRVQSTDAMRIDGAPGYEIRAQGKGLNDEPMMLAQWLRFTGGSFLRTVGVGRKQDWDALFTRLRAVRDGVAMR